mgnify:CR=1 FL=1
MMARSFFQRRAYERARRQNIKAREAERIRKESIAEYNRQIKAHEAARREHERKLKEYQKEQERRKKEAELAAREKYVNEMIEKAASLTRKAESKLESIENILKKAYFKDIENQFNLLKRTEEFPDFQLPKEYQHVPQMPLIQDFLSSVPELKGIANLMPRSKRKHAEKLALAKQRFYYAKQQYDQYMNYRGAHIAHLQNEHESLKQKAITEIRTFNLQIDQNFEKFKNGEPEKIIAATTMNLWNSKYPSSFPKKYRVNYNPEPKELIIEYELPKKDVIPTVVEYRYIKNRDEIVEKQLKPNDIALIYQDLVAAITLRTLAESFFIDKFNHVDVISFNGMVSTIDPATGQDIRPCLISVRTTKEQFTQIKLNRVDKKVCLRNLGAATSPRPEESFAIKPIVEFDMFDKRFIESGDSLSFLDSRPNIMDFDPFEFEELITNLFQKMGYETRRTQASRDGGVDCVAYDNRPLVGGKVVIQAKRYKNVVGVDAVRELYGTVINEGANKGILVTTSHFGQLAYEFISDKPITLMDGSALLYYLNEIGYAAKIIMPDD